MIRLDKPQIQQSEVVDDCLDNMRKNEKREKLSKAKDEIIKFSEEYDLLAECGNLSSISPKDKSESGASKGELISLYDDKFSKKGQTARKYNDSIIL